MWLLLRLVVAPFAAAAGGHPIFLSPAAALPVIAVCALLCWLVTHRRFEDLMLANLGTSPWMVVCLMAIPPVVLEFAIARLALV